MELKINTQITQQQSFSLNDQLVLNNTFTGKDVDTSDFEVDIVDVKQYTVTVAQAVTFSLDLFASSSITADKATFVHIYCFNATDASCETPDPIRFRLTLGGNVIGNMSQIQLANLDTYSDAVVVDQLVVPTGKTAGLTVIIGAVQ